MRPREAAANRARQARASSAISRGAGVWLLNARMVRFGGGSREANGIGENPTSRRAELLKHTCPSAVIDCARRHRLDFSTQSDGSNPAPCKNCLATSLIASVTDIPFDFSLPT